MGGRDPHEQHRTATPLELLYDLVFVVAFGVAGSQLAHELAAGHAVAGLGAFAFCLFAVVWAWINFAWFASAYDTDDWLFRLLAMVQMGGVTLLALGIPDVFRSISDGQHLDNRVLVTGYVIMRLGLVAQWARAWTHDVARRPAISVYILTLVVAQAGWVVHGFAQLTLSAAVVMGLVLFSVELTGPFLAERGEGTPWHPDHIAERYSLLTIIALGEGVVGTIASLEILLEQGWTADAVRLLIAGVALTFAIWWCYFVLPAGPALQLRRERSFGWGYGHILIYAAIAAMGAGLHVVAYYLDAEHAGFEVVIGPVGTVLTVAVPVLVFIAALDATYLQLTRTWHPLHGGLLLASGIVVAAVVALAAAGVPVTVCLLLLVLAPVVSVVGLEVRGHEHRDADIAALERQQLG